MTAMAALAKEMQQLASALKQESAPKATGKDSAKESASGGRSFMAHSYNPSLWLPQTDVGEGFGFADSYSSDGSDGMGLLGTQPAVELKARCGVPVGMVPTAWVNTRQAGRRGRPPTVPQAPVPSASARRQERMHQEDHDEMRAVRNRLPPGMTNPADVAIPPQASSQPDVDGADDHSSMVMRVAQLVSLLRTCLAHTKFGSLPTELVSDTSVEGAAAWQRARAAAMAGAQHDGQDPRSVAWHTAIQKAVALWQAQAQLTWRDFTRIDLRAVFREAVLVTYGAEAASQLSGIPTPAIGFQLEPNQNPPGQEPLVQTAATHAEAVEDPLPSSTVESDCPHPGVQPIPMPRRQVSHQTVQQALEQHRQARAEWQQSVRWPTRRPVAMLDGSAAGITLNGHPVKHLCLDLGANEPMANVSLISQLGVATDPNGRRITGITGKPHMMPRTTKEMVVTLFPDDPEKEAQASDHMVVMKGEALPDVLLDTEMMAQLGIVVDPCRWVATLPSKPYQPDSEPVVLPLSRPSAAQLTAISVLQGDLWPQSCVEEDTATDEAATPFQGFQGFCCVALTVPANSHPVSGVGGGSVDLLSAADVAPPNFSSTHTEQDEQSASNPFPPDMPYREVYTALFAAMEEADSVEGDDDGDGVVLAAHKTRREYTQADLDAVPALPYQPEDKLFAVDLQALQGHRYGGISGFYPCAGVLTSLVIDVVEGAHMKRVRVLERNPKRRAQGERVLNTLHSHYPDRVPRSAIDKAFSWADPIDHDCYLIDGSRLFREFGADCELLVHVEAGCQGHSALGPKNGFNHPESGALVPIAEALTDLQYILARKRGFRDWSAAPSQFGYIMENVPGPHSTSQHTPETLMAVEFMDRVFGSPVYHDPATCGDLASRKAKWWSNMFTKDFYVTHEPLFRRGPYASLSQVVRECTDGKLKPQTVTTKRQLMGGLNVLGEEARILSKFVSRPSTVSQRMASDGTPGLGMLEVVGSNPPRYVPCPSSVRLAAHQFWPPHIECLKPVTDETEMIRTVGNVCAPTSLRVMLRMGIGYSAFVQQQSTTDSTLASPLLGKAEGRSVEDSRSALHRAVERAAAEEITMVTAMEQEYAAASAALKPSAARGQEAKPRTVTMALASAARQKARTDARILHAKAMEAAKARQMAAKKMEGARVSQQKQKAWARTKDTLSSTSRNRNVASAAVMLLLVAALWGPAAYRAGMAAGSQAGVASEASFYISGSMIIDAPDYPEWPDGGGPGQLEAYESMDFAALHATEMDSRYRQAAAPGHCLYELANQPATGKSEEACAVPSKLLSSQDGTQHEWQIGSGFQLKQAFAELMDSVPEWYAWGLKDLRQVKGMEYSITLSDPRPIFARQYHLAHRESEFAESWVKELEQAGVVREVESPYAAPVVVAPKKDETGKWTDLRYAIDYRRLNAVTIRDQYPTPVPDEILARMEGAELFSSMDAQKAFHQVAVAAETQPLLAFHSKGRLMTWNRMPFGGKNSVACWQRVVDEALAGVSFAQAYADDIVVWSDGNETEHMRRVQVVMERLHAKGVQVSPKKCKLGMRKLEFLGHIVSGEGVEPMWDKVEAISKLPRPTSASEVRSFIGMATYYCKFLDHYSHVKRPLTELTKKDTAFVWGAAQEAAWQQIKDMLVSPLVLKNPDWSRPFILHTDWSKAGVGACLSQIGKDGREYAIAFASRMNSRAEAAFSSYEGEVSAVVYAVQRFRYYLWGQPFRLITDCKAMQWLTTTAKLRSKLARWSLILAEYDFEIVHRAGKDNTVPDLLSRQPTEKPVSYGPVTGIAFHTARRPSIPEQAMGFISGQWAAPVAAGWLAGYLLDSSSTRFDPWTDPEAVQFLHGELAREVVTPARWTTLQRKCSRYLVNEDRVWYRAAAGQLLEVPPPDQRPAIVLKVHQENGHLGRDRTHAMVAQRYTWPGLWKTVADTLKSCSQCDRVRASFNTKMDVLKPLPLMGLFYRFHLDAAVNLPESAKGIRHVLIIVEAFSKWIDLVPFTELTAAAVASAFRERVLARFGRPVEVTTDNGAEYKAEFHQLCVELGIDHRLITPGHPEANGLAERIVKVLKTSLRKYVLVHGVSAWPDQLPTIEFGYRTTPQRSTGFSPYFLVYGRHPVYPPQVKALLDGATVDVEDEDAMLQLITERAARLREAMPLAFERAAISQHKNAVRFQRVRRRDLPPRQHRFKVGDYVYVSQRPINSLDVKTTRTILRVRAVHPHGVLELEGADGRTVRVRMELCAPCHIPNLVTDELGVPADLACEVCGSPSMADPMLLCDRCDRGYHLHCLSPPLERVPAGQWCCPQCLRPAAPARPELQYQ